MKYSIVESRLKTSKTREYLWNKINSIDKIIKIEGFKIISSRRISENNYELIMHDERVIASFFPKKGMNMVFVGRISYPLVWFEIIGEKNCVIVHGEYKRIDSIKNKANLEKDIAAIKKHFMQELQKIAR